MDVDDDDDENVADDDVEDHNVTEEEVEEDDVAEDVADDDDGDGDDDDDDAEEDEDEDDDDNAEDEVEDDKVEDNDAEKEEYDDVDDDNVEEDDEQDDNVAEDEVEPHFVRACAVEIHFNISQEPLYTEIYRKNAAAQNEPRTQTHISCEPAQSKRTSTFSKSHFLHGNIPEKCRGAEWAPWSSTGLYTYRKNLSVWWTHCLGNLCELFFFWHTVFLAIGKFATEPCGPAED